MKQMDTKKLVLACLVIMILMIVYTKVDQSRQYKEAAVETTAAVQVEKNPQSLLLSDRMEAAASLAAEEPEGDSSEGSENEEEILGPAEKMNLQSARKEAYGLVVELDYVSEAKISLHGNFGYMVFALEGAEDGTISAVNTNAVTLEELGGLTMGGAAYTDVLAGDGVALIMPGIHNEEIARRRKFLYIEETNEITGGIVAPQWMMEKMAENDYSDAIVEETLTAELTELIRTEHEGKLLYGPVVVPEYDSNVYGFLAENGENLEDVWYGLWMRDTGTVKKIVLFE